MDSKDILRRVRYIFDLDDYEMIALFAAADYQVTREQICDWLKEEGDPASRECTDAELAAFLNGFIIEKRGRKDGPQERPEQRLTNNGVFMKLKIALNLKAEEVLELLELVDFRLSKHELSAFFRRPDHKHYRECKDQVLRNFLNGLQTRYRGENKPVTASVWDKK